MWKLKYCTAASVLRPAHCPQRMARHSIPRVVARSRGGRCYQRGQSCKNFKVGDLAAVGCMVDSCGDCEYCKEGLEQCSTSNTLTYNSPDSNLGVQTYGGYSESIVVNEHFVLRVPENLDPAATLALLPVSLPILH